MKVSKYWLPELVDLKIPLSELEKLLPLRTIATKEINDQFIELDMKGYNRSDLLSMRGVAYEVSAITDSHVKFSEPDETKYLWVEKNFPNLKVTVEDEMLCPLYCLAKVEGLKVEPSPENWVKKLNDSGIRSVNSVADVTNLVMLEYGQPLHAFDARMVQDETIVVRTAKAGEKILTLDDKERALETNDLLITDPQKALGIAGVMGGKNSEVTDSTTTILLEAAIFDPGALRHTATRLGLTSEASRRFYHGLTKKRLFQALNVALEMYQELGGKVTALSITGSLEDQAKKVPLTLKKVNSLIGVELTEQKTEGYLSKLRFELSDKVVQDSEVSWVVTPPYFRLDIEIEEDLIEEVVRMYGYENIPAKKLAGETPEKIDQKLFDFIYNLKKELAKQGLTEVQTYSFTPSRMLSLGLQEKGESIKVANPISSETEYLRSWLSPNLLEVVDKNLRQGIKNIYIFEVGKIYLKPEKMGQMPQELYKLALAFSFDDNLLVNKIFQAFNSVSEKLALPDIEAKQTEPDQKTKSLFHPTRFANIFYKSEDIGFIAEFHPRVLDQLGIKQRVAGLEINLDLLLK